MATAHNRAVNPTPERKPAVTTATTASRPKPRGQKPQNAQKPSHTPKPQKPPKPPRQREPRVPSEAWNVTMPYLLWGVAALLTLLYVILFIPKLMGDTGEAGVIGDFLNALMLWLGGWASYMVPAILAVVALRWRQVTDMGKTHGILWMQAGLVFTLTASIFELLGNYAEQSEFSEYFSALASFGADELVLKGGAIGGLFAFVMRWALRTVISSVLLIVADLLCIIFFLNGSPEKILSWFKDYLQKRREEREANAALAVEEDEEENEIRRAIDAQEREAAIRLKMEERRRKQEENERKKAEAAARKEEERLERQRIKEELAAQKAASRAESLPQDEADALSADAPQDATPVTAPANDQPADKPEEGALSAEVTPAEEPTEAQETPAIAACDTAEPAIAAAEPAPAVEAKPKATLDGFANDMAQTRPAEHRDEVPEEHESPNVTELDFTLKDPETRTKIPKSKLPGDDDLFGSFGQPASSPRRAPAEAVAAEESIPLLPTEEEQGGVVDDVDDGVDFVAPPTEEELKEPEYVFPSFDLLAEDTATTDISQFMDEIQEKQQELGQALTSFGVRYRKIEFSRGPTITRYEIQPEPGQRVKTIQNLMDDIALSMAVSGVRFEPSIPGKSAVGIEVPNTTRETVFLRGLVESEAFQNEKSRLTSCLGADITGRPVVFDISKMPHLLVAGATGMGKSVCINSIILSLLYKAKPDEVKMILIDPKKVEFAIYRDMPHLQIPVISDPQKAAGALCSAVSEMEKRFELIERVGARDIGGYKKLTAGDPDMPKMWHIVIIIDELADLMMTASDDVEKAICRLAQKARAAGIHLIIGTQRPSVDVITGTIKANIPSRIAFTVASQTDSRTILDSQGAEKLVGKGDMLFAPVGASKPRRVQGSFVSEDEVIRVVNFLIRNNGTAMYDSQFMENIDIEAERCANSKKASESAAMLDDGNEDPKMGEAIALAIETGKISTSLMQRRLEIGYGRAAKIIDRMEQLGYVSAADGNKPRKILITMEEYLAQTGAEE